MVLAEALTVHLYTQLGIPVSTSQALVGAVAGIGFVRGIRTVNRKLLLEIFGAWLATPVLAGLAAWVGSRILATL